MVEVVAKNAGALGAWSCSNAYSLISTKPLSPNRNHFSKKRTTLETQIASQNRGSSLLFETKGIDIYRVGRTSEGGSPETPAFTSLSGYQRSDGRVRRHCSPRLRG